MSRTGDSRPAYMSRGGCGNRVLGDGVNRIAGLPQLFLTQLFYPIHALKSTIPFGEKVADLEIFARFQLTASRFISIPERSF